MLEDGACAGPSPRPPRDRLNSGTHDIDHSLTASSLFIYPEGVSHSSPSDSTARTARPKDVAAEAGGSVKRLSQQGVKRSQAAVPKQPLSAPPRRGAATSAHRQTDRTIPKQQQQQSDGRRVPGGGHAAAAPEPRRSMSSGDNSFRMTFTSPRRDSTSTAGSSATAGSNSQPRARKLSVADERAEAFLERFPNSSVAGALRQRISDSSGDPAGADPARNSTHPGVAGALQRRISDSAGDSAGAGPARNKTRPGVILPQVAPDARLNSQQQQKQHVTPDDSRQSSDWGRPEVAAPSEVPHDATLPERAPSSDESSEEWTQTETSDRQSDSIEAVPAVPAATVVQEQPPPMPHSKQSANEVQQPVVHAAALPVKVLLPSVSLGPHPITAGKASKPGTPEKPPRVYAGQARVVPITGQRSAPYGIGSRLQQPGRSSTSMTATLPLSSAASDQQPQSPSRRNSAPIEGGQHTSPGEAASGRGNTMAKLR